jgi:hypothetical protein
MRPFYLAGVRRYHCNLFQYNSSTLSKVERKDKCLDQQQEMNQAVLQAAETRIMIAKPRESDSMVNGAFCRACLIHYSAHRSCYRCNVNAKIEGVMGQLRFMFGSPSCGLFKWELATLSDNR